jgi:ATP-binding protein involved in chromosome partitioning
MKTYHDIATDGGSDVLGQVAEQAGRMRQRLANVRHVVAVMSGKGGVGKSSVAVNLAASLVTSGQAVGLVDGDLNGPSIGKMAGVLGQELQRTPTGIAPAWAAAGFSVMSMDLFLEEETAPLVWDATTQKDAFTWRGLMEAGALREFVSDTDWGLLDYLIVDLPPGADKLPNLADVLPRLSGAVVVTIPSAVSLAVVGKSVRMAQEVLGTKILGIVENMTGYECPTCGTEDVLFPAGRVERLAHRLDIPVIGRIPFDPLMAFAADEGRPYVHDHPDRPAARALFQLTEHIRSLLD